MSRYIKYIILLLAAAPCTIFAANAIDKKVQLADSIHSVLNNKSLSDSIRVVHLSELALMDYYLNQENSKAKSYLNKAKSLIKNPNNEDLQVFIYTTEIQITSESEELDKVIDSCIYYTAKAVNPLVRSIGWQKLARVKRNTPQEVDYMNKALAEIKGQNYWLQEQAIYYDMVHNSYLIRETYPRAIDYSKLALESAQQSGNNYIIAKSWGELGIAYLMNYNLTQEDKVLSDKAYDSFIYAYNMYKDGDVDLSIRSNQLLYNTILINLSNIETLRGNKAHTIKYLEEALNISLRYNESNAIDYNMKPYIYHSAKMNILQCYTTLSSIYKSLGKHNEAEKYLLEAIKFLPKTALDDLRNGNYPAHRILISLGDLYYETGRYEDAFKYYGMGYEQYKVYYDYRLEGIAEHMNRAYEHNRKQQNIEVLKDTLSQNQRNNYLFIILIGVIIGTVVLLYLFQRNRLILIKQQQDLHDREEKILIASKEEKELESRLNIYKTNKYKKDLFTETLLVDHKNKIVEDLRLFFMNNHSLKKYRNELESILDIQMNIEKEKEDFNLNIQDINPTFYMQLQEYADNKLTSLDLKYCYMILMKMSSKEMADILHVDSGTIRVNKYRLKQKLRLDKNEDLNLFIRNIQE